MTRCFASWLACLLAITARGQALQFGQLSVTQSSGADSPAAQVITIAPGASGGVIGASSNRGDYDLRFGTANDLLSGLLFACPAENARDNSGAGDAFGTFHAIVTSATPDQLSGIAGAKACVFRSPQGEEVNLNVNFAFFPFASLLAGRASNSANDTPLDSIIASPGIQIGAGEEFQNTAVPGQYLLDLRALGGFSNAGVLLVCGGKDEANFALSRANGDGTFSLWCHDRAVGSAVFEADPVAFAFVPGHAAGTAPVVALARVNNDATTDIASGHFLLTKGATGEWFLAIPGHSASTGVLLVSPEGGGANTNDNIVSSQWDATNQRWVIQSRDIEDAATAPALQDGGSAGEDMFSFVFLSASGLAVLPLVPSRSEWKYRDDGSDQGTAWRATGFDDSAWASGPAELGYGDAPATTVSYGPDSSSKHITTWFRRRFTVPNPAAIGALSLWLQRDDGAVVYLNGTEIARSNVPAGAITKDTLAAASAGAPDESAFFPADISSDPLPLLVAGENVLAVEMHQHAADSSDLSFDLELAVTTVAVGVKPVVAVTAPANLATFPAPATVDIAADASDPDGTIAKVEFFAGEMKLGEDSAAPYVWQWFIPAPGTHTLRARAWDDQGNASDSAGVTIIALPASESGLLTRGPYLNMADDTGIVVRWRSSQAVTGRVRYGLTMGSLTQLADEASTTTEHEVALSGLAPGTRYFYSVGSAADVLAGGDDTHTFLTAPAAAAPVRVWVLGDAGRANSSQAAVRNAYQTWTGSRMPDLCLMLGDNAYSSGTDSEYQAAVFDMYSAFLRRVPLWSCLGNHDTGGSTSASESFPYFDMFSFPVAGECGGVPSGTERYFSFDHGNIHVVSLDSQTSDRSPSGAMAQWLAADLASTTKTWIIAAFHHPPYSKGSHDSDAESQLVEMRQNFGPILEAGGVDLVLVGHSHSYERSVLLDGHYGHSSTLVPAMKKNAGSGRPGGAGAYIKPLTGPRDHFGAVYTLAGSAGSADGGPLNHPAMFISLDTLGSLNLDINGSRLDATYIEADHEIADFFTIIKQGAADSDGDGVADEFEIAHGMNRHDAADAVLDADADGNDARAEYLFGLDPAQADRYPWTTTRNAATGFTEVTFPTLPQRVYRVLFSHDLLQWEPASTEIAGDGTTKTWTDDGTQTGGLPAAAQRRFYRVQAGNGP